MTIVHSPADYVLDDLYVDLERVIGHALLLKVEGLNFAGSVKLKAARSMVAAAEFDGTLRPGSTLVESSSGNLGVALSMIAADRGYEFICVTDTRCNLATRQLMTSLGAQVQVISTPHPESGYLGARLERVAELCAEDPARVWLNQYANPENARAHYRLTAPAIARSVPDVDVLFVGAGSCGTLMGCARWFREWYRDVRVVAVDAVGSVLFGDAPATRVVPGLGSAVPSPVLDRSLVDDVVLVEEADTVRACLHLARSGYLFGGSTGTVVSAAARWLTEHSGLRPLRAVAIAPDLGERYLDTVYQSTWVREMFGADLLEPVSTSGGAQAYATSG